MTDTAIDVGLTAENVKALRSADDYVSFHFDRSVPEWGPVGACVRAVQRIRGRNGFGDTEAAVEIPLSDVTFTIYQRDGSGTAPEPVKAYWGISVPKFCPEWATVVSLLRTGDRLVAHWSANTQTFPDHGLTTDQFRLLIYRGPRGKAKVMTFLLDTQTLNPDRLSRNLTW